MVNFFYVADMSDSSLSGAGSTCIKKNKTLSSSFSLPERMSGRWDMGHLLDIICTLFLVFTTIIFPSDLTLCYPYLISDLSCYL